MTFDEALSGLKDWLSIPSVSTDPTHQNDIQNAAEWAKDFLLTSGFSNARLMDTAGNPVVFASYEASPEKPTVLFYGHYDVQPADPLELWDTPPFEPTVRDGQLIARGASDDKGQVFCHMAALKNIFESDGKFSVNIKILIEGEEEIGSPSLGAFVETHKDLLAADILLVSDTPMYAKNQPSICTSLRGLVYFQIDLVTGPTDLHSGQQGGVAPNAIQELIQILSQLKNREGKVLVPGFYDHVRKTSIPAGFCDDKTASELERKWYLPTMDINGIWGGYTGEGSKTVIPAKASAKFSFRLVADQDPIDIANDIQIYVQSLIPAYVVAKVTHLTEGAEGYPVNVSPDSKGIPEAMAALEKVWGVKPIFQGEGGSIPVITFFQRILKLPPVLMGLNLPDDKIHAPNEQFSLENICNGIEASQLFWTSFSK